MSARIRREWMEFRVEGLKVYSVTMFYCNQNRSHTQLIAAPSKAEAIRIMRAEKKMFNRRLDFKGHGYEFRAERATVLRPLAAGGAGPEEEGGGKGG